jgi:ABC-type transporter Mla subunit MlaD
VIPFLLDPRLIARALDDLHTIARVAGGLEARLASAERTVEEAIVAARALAGIEARAVDLLERVDRVDARFGEILGSLDQLGSVDAHIVELVRLAEEVRDGLPGLRQVLTTVEQLGTTTATLATTAEPLQGAAERLGRIADRLPAPRARKKAN